MKFLESKAPTLLLYFYKDTLVMHSKAVKYNSKELVIKEIDDYGLYSSYISKLNGNCNMKLFCCTVKMISVPKQTTKLKYLIFVAEMIEWWD